jgi:hypothetical protein
VAFGITAMFNSLRKKILFNSLIDEVHELDKEYKSKGKADFFEAFPWKKAKIVLKHMLFRSYELFRIKITKTRIFSLKTNTENLHTRRRNLGA